MTRSPAEMADGLESMAWSKQVWLSDFSEGRKKRPDHEITAKRNELDLLQQAAAYIRRTAAERTGGIA